MLAEARRTGVVFGLMGSKLTLGAATLAVLVAGWAALAQADPGTREAGSDGPGKRYCPRGDRSGYDSRDLIGRNMPTARRIAAENECTTRVIERNGRALGVTDDWRTDRINVRISDHRVIDVAGTF